MSKIIGGPMAALARAGAVLSLALLVSGCPHSQPGDGLSEVQALPWVEVTDCPHYWSEYRPRGQPNDTIAPLSGSWVDVPEYNDCQALTAQGTTEYQGLGALFPSERLGRLVNDIADSSAAAGAPRAITAVTVVAVNGDYPDLGMEYGANCLYLYQDAAGAWSARMVPVSDGGAACRKALDIALPVGTVLQVHLVDLPTTPAPLPVARWERNAGGKQAVGVLCGTQWCSAVPAGYGTGPMPGVAVDATLGSWLQSLPGSSSNVATPVELMGLALSRGWMDDQYLAPAGGGSSPTGLWAAVIPHPRLKDVTTDDFYRDWRAAAFVYIPPGQGASNALSGYTSKYGYREGWNAILLCNGKAGSPCTPASPACAKAPDATKGEGRWYAHVVSRATGAVREFCVKSRHQGMNVPGTARWRWLRNDETVWVRCVNGCCEVEDPS
jgi:hypothetical protein